MTDQSESPSCFSVWSLWQVLDVNVGVVMFGYWLYKLGIDIEFKISVYLGRRALMLLGGGLTVASVCRYRFFT